MLQQCTIVLLVLIGTINAATEQQQCIAETEALAGNEAIIAAYEEVKFDKTSRRILKEIEELQVFDYFASPEGQTNYKNTCEKEGGIYHLLKFNATCEETDEATQEALVKDSLEVSSFPRCYGASCSAEDAEFLFQEFTLRPTEDLNKKHSKFYTTCKGALLDDKTGDPAGVETSDNAPVASGQDGDSIVEDPQLEGCDAEIASIEANARLLDAYMLMNPKINRQSVSTGANGGSVDTRVAVSIVYDSTTNFKSACEESGFVYVEAGPFAMDCFSEKTSLKFSVSSFPRCLGQGCKVNDFTNDSVAQKDFAFDQGGTDWNKKSYQCFDSVFVEGGCEDQTKTLDATTEIVTAFNNIVPSINHLAESPSLRDPIDTKIKITIDYNTTSTKSFHDACETHGFLYLETEGLAMTCHSIKKTTELEFEVAFFPKCVPVNCEAAESQIVYDFETLKERAFLHSGGNWEQEDFDCEEPEVYEESTNWHFYILVTVSICLSTAAICVWAQRHLDKRACLRRHSKIVTISTDECSVWNDIDLDSICSWE